MKRPKKKITRRQNKKNNKNLLAIGRLSVHPKGFGFVSREEGPDIFIPKQRLLHAVDGDEVEVSIAAEVSPKGPEGSVVAIIARNRSSLAGIVLKRVVNGRHQIYAPLLGKEKPLWIETKEPISEGDRILCHISSWDDGKGGALGTLLERIGHISDPSIDVKAAVAEFELFSSFSEEAVQEAKSYGGKVSAAEKRERLDLSKEECVTIDPDTARDFDDAISLTQDEQGHFHLGVHIADVAHYVKVGSHLDKEALSRCNSTYFPGECVPMLPEALSNELCSLKPKVERLAESLLAEFDGEGNLISYRIARTCICSAKRFTYKEALAVLEKKKRSSHAPLLQRMVHLCGLLKKKRFERGSIDFSMTERRIAVDKKGAPLCIEEIEYDITHQMIEEFMLKANELVAIHLNERGKRLIYRIHDEPRDEAFSDFFGFARSLGFSLPPKPTHLDVQHLFKEAKDSPLLSQLSVSFIRSMRLAAYSPDNIGHYGLALEHYCHFTSPIRRYSDLVIQRLLFEEEPASLSLDEVAERCSEKERLSFRAESSVVRLKKLRLAETYFTSEPERVYPAVVSRVKPYFLFFEVPLFDLEGSLHVSEIGNDYYEFDAEKMRFCGEHTGKIFQAGSGLYVRLTQIDYLLQEAHWTVTHPPRIKRASK
ncbi:MAG: VacB/RNase II family 3'-5' exoribonuclease [Verrucomicrobiota bacterium]|nr:VacB/RNase II family 3'-5' exoribonuclease [Verrucomicrobiota bacterium]